MTYIGPSRASSSQRGDRLVVRALTGAPRAPRPDNDNESSRDSSLDNLRAVGVASAASLAAAAAPASAEAAEHFKPRRSHRRLPGWEEQHPEVFLHAAKGMVRAKRDKAARIAQKALRGEEPGLTINLPIPSRVPGMDHVSAAASAAGKAVSSAHKSVKKAMAEQPVTMSARGIPSTTPSYARQTDAQTAYIVGGGIVALLGFFMWQAIARGKSRRSGGRYVRDRSLGGKEIWIADGFDDAGMPIRGASPSRGPRAVFSAEDLAVDGDATAAAAPSSAAPSPAAVAPATPGWWTEPRTRYVREGEKEMIRARASQYLRGMEEQKYNGQDYSMEAVREMVQLGLEGNVTLRPRTDSGRDAIFRFATDHAIEASFTGRTLMLGGIRGREFLPALAQTIGVPTQRACDIATGAVAAKTRALLLSALAHVRAKDDIMAYTDLSYLAMLWRELPLEEGSPQVDMLARSLSATMQAREARELLRMFEEATSRDAGLSALMREALLMYQS